MRIFPKLDFHGPRRLHSPVRRPPRRAVSPTPVRALDLSATVSAAGSVEDLYSSIVSTIRRTFSTSAVTLFVRDEETASFPCRASTIVFNDAEPSVGLPALSSDSFVVRRLKSLSSPLQLETEELNAWKEALRDAPRDVLEKRMLERDVLLKTHSILLVQLRTKSGLLGVLTFGQRMNSGFTPSEREAIENIAGQLALIVENAKLLQRLVEHERLRAELTVAAEVQRNLLPAAGPSLAGIELCGFCQPASQVGGDYYDFVPLGENRVGICIADVAGKGISAALLMSVVQASLRSQLFSPHQQSSAAEVVTMLNRLICTSISASRYVTCFYGQFDVENGSFRFVNAGHNPPLLLRCIPVEEEAAFQPLLTDGIVLGMFPEAAFGESHASLRPGDVLVAYTDGVTEAMSVAHEEFTETRLRQAIVEVSARSAKEILAHIITHVAKWSQGASQHDDITVVVLKVAA